MKKFTALTILFTIVFCTVTTYAQENFADTLNADIVLSSSQQSAVLKDGKTHSKLTLPENTTISISSQMDIYGVYLIWDKPPLPFTLKGENNSYSGAENGFLHEYIPISEAEKSLQISLPSGGVLTDIYFFGKGETPSWVQKWKPPYEKADMLLFSTHADDEHIFFGGTMPYYAGEKKFDVQVCYLTNHWGEPYRNHELLNGLWTVGITAYPIISPYPDYYSQSLEHAKGLYGEEEIIKYQTELIRRFKPYVIIGHDLNGEYGHGVHMLNAYSVTKAIEAAPNKDIYPETALKYGVWEPLKTYLHLYPQDNISLEWDTPLSRFDGKTAFEMAVEGFACHKSQQKWFSVGKNGVYDCRSFGLYKSLVGKDVSKDDFFENIDIESLKNPPPAPTPIPAESADSKQEGTNGTYITKNILTIAVPTILIAVLLSVAVIIYKRKR